jgi:DNA-binding response OmpR family regulator
MASRYNHHAAPDGPPRLLIVDDEEAILVPVSRFLTGRGYAVVTSREPEEAEALLDNERFDLVILDLALTRFGREGLEVLASLRSRHPWLPVIVMSANLCPEVEDEARRLQVDALLSKPQPLAELARVAEAAMGLRS